MWAADWGYPAAALYPPNTSTPDARVTIFLVRSRGDVDVGADGGHGADARADGLLRLVVVVGSLAAMA